jgi:hypothetical protein
MLDVMEASVELEKAILKGEGYNLRVELENFDAELKAAIERDIIGSPVFSTPLCAAFNFLLVENRFTFRKIINP